MRLAVAECWRSWRFLPVTESAGGGALRLDLQHVQRLARRHQQVIALRAAERDVGAYLGQTDAADQLALRVVDKHASIAERPVRAAPEIAGHVGTHAIGPALHAVGREVKEVAPIGHLRSLDIERMDGARAAGMAVAWSPPRAAHVEGLVVGREAESV